MYCGKIIPGDNSCFSHGTADRNRSPACDTLLGGAKQSHDNPSAPLRAGSAHAGLVKEAFQPVNLRDKRIACLLVPDFAVAAIARANPELRERPFALTRMPTPRRATGNSRGLGRKAAEYQP